MYFLKSRLGLLNFFILQWVFVRLQETVDGVDGSHEKWDLLWGVVPLTGWWTRYVWLWGRKK